ncbi:glycosyltransferase family 4 protein [Salinimicrobium sediminilitoris]|uniref:glycosyltransferase family 4 protein n=1 Tax=Salinimicrobium sediminilitoris TaxID=2876715 RepID=UPI001E2EFC0D|nr:glycosyltransferase family 4 protein [Salinimicrobium sediminilitoris]MCC8358740.1 glycosyltransferase family 4 protein [Salinimicrobium sediminilitoris]
MKILQLVTKRQYRGAEVFAANLSAELIKLGHEIIFTGLYKNEVNILEVNKADNRDLSPAKSGSFSFPLLRSLVNLIKEKKPEIIQCNGSDTLKYMVAASFFIPKTPIIYRNISIISEWLSNRPKHLIYKSIFKRVDHVSSVGDQAIEDLITTFNYPRNQTSVIRRGIPVKEIDNAKQRAILINELGLNEKDQISMHIGNFSPEKNHQFLLNIFTELKDTHPHLKLILVGTGDLFEEIEKQIAEKDLQQTIFLTGFRKDIPELLAAADCFLLASKIEGVPGVILEAAAQKKPSIATNVGGVREVLKNEETGFIIDDFDQDEFASKLILLMNDGGLRAEMGENAYKLVLTEFNPKNNAQKFEDIYTHLNLDYKKN